MRGRDRERGRREMWVGNTRTELRADLYIASVTDSITKPNAISSDMYRHHASLASDINYNLAKCDLPVSNTSDSP